MSRFVEQVGALIEAEPDRSEAARIVARTALMALVYLDGPHSAAEVAYRLADEMAEAIQSVRR